jgi:hypothetical protein
MWDGTFSVRAASLVSTDPPYELHSRDGSRPLRLLDRVLAQTSKSSGMTGS